MGQIVGAVVAENREQAKRAAGKVKVTYEDLLPVFFTIQVKHIGHDIDIRPSEMPDHHTFIHRLVMTVKL